MGLPVTQTPCQQHNGACQARTMALGHARQWPAPTRACAGVGGGGRGEGEPPLSTLPLRHMHCGWGGPGRPQTRTESVLPRQRGPVVGIPGVVVVVAGIGLRLSPSTSRSPTTCLAAFPCA